MRPQTDTKVRILSDYWSTFGQIAIVINPEPVPGSSQILLDLNGDLITLARGEVEPVRNKCKCSPRKARNNITTSTG